MAKGKLYGIGVGPGDPELLTLKAVRLLKEADIIGVPDKGSGEKTALNIVKEFVDTEKVRYFPTPMIRDKAALQKNYEQQADAICEYLEDGKTVVFITLGDPTVYSTYYYVHEIVAKRGYEAILVPGVPSFCAVAARVGTSLCERSDRLLIVPASSSVEDALEVKANKVFMKAGSSILELQEQLKKAGKLQNAFVVENCGMENEHVWQHFSDMTEPSGYFSIVIVK